MFPASIPVPFRFVCLPLLLYIHFSLKPPDAANNTTIAPIINVVRAKQNETPAPTVAMTTVPFTRDNNTPSTPEQEAASQAVLRGMRLLGVELSKTVAAKVATSHAGMMVMGRFLLEGPHADTTPMDRFLLENPHADVAMAEPEGDAADESKMDADKP
ncbi:hypothetical protein B0T26DRAFT_682006 [Lasiosphaeria miniovina]|uniref:Uncharacterized protein n=1 Tax=Lasiosphaeria miniovina TaxID=1954250 RepID=A0AA39ZQP0_9PEZI|nr:uncharacterized protein B0T26DRAFT_682006 [Lasiosphaeria miniovina]KAK0701909.1 hypothetical protein B0T26DRAFT_682006 [Lasiosphaeria miniovina]